MTFFFGRTVETSNSISSHVNLPSRLVWRIYVANSPFFEKQLKWNKNFFFCNRKRGGSWRHVSIFSRFGPFVIGCASQMKEGSEPQGIQKSLSIKQTNMKTKSIINCSSLQSRVTGNTYEREKKPVYKDYKQPFLFYFNYSTFSNFNYFLLPSFLARIY